MHYIILSNYVKIFKMDAQMSEIFKGKIPQKFHLLTSIGQKSLILLL